MRVTRDGAVFGRGCVVGEEWGVYVVSVFEWVVGFDVGGGGLCVGECEDDGGGG